MIDDRGRVPFAVVAILLLVSSATVATTMGPEPAPDEPAVDVVVDRVEAEQQTALRRAVRQAADAAASDPVITPADTAVGRALGRSKTFRNSLRLRIYLAAREQLAGIERRRGDVVATVDLPAIDAGDSESVRAAIERVQFDREATNGTVITATVRNVTTTVRRGDRTLSERTDSIQVSVTTPVLAMHRRVSAYQQRLNAPVTEPGLERRLTAVMNAAGWARGYAQYGGAPIDNIISNGHVGVATNAVALDLQRATIGGVDRDAEGALVAATGKLAASDLLAMRAQASPFLQQAIDQHSVVRPNDIQGLDVPPRDEPITIGVNQTAEDAFLFMIDSRRKLGLGYSVSRESDLTNLTRATYTVDVKLAAERSKSGRIPSATPPGPGWQRSTSTVDSTTTVYRREPSGPVDATGQWHALETYSRRIVTEHERTTIWTKAGRREKTWSTGRTVTTVDISVLGKHAPRAPGPSGTIDGAHERGAGPIDGDNYDGVRSTAMDRLIAQQGGKDAVAKSVAEGTLGWSNATIERLPSGNVSTYLYRDLRDLRKEVYNISVEVERRDLGTFEVNPPRRLKDKIESRRAELIDASRPYDGVAERARAAARARYLDVVMKGLEIRARERAKRGGALEKALGKRDAGSIEDVQKSVDATVAKPGAEMPPLRGPGGPIHLRVDAAPAYLTTSEIEESDVPAVDGRMTPLDARNVNLFTMPYGDLISGFLGAIMGGPDRSSLATAAETVKTSDQYLAADAPFLLSLEGKVGKKVDFVAGFARTTLAAHDVGRNDAARRQIVTEALGQWNSTADRALALTNGSATAAIVDEVDERYDLTDIQRDRLRLELGRSIRYALEHNGARPKSSTVKGVRRAVRTEATGVLQDAARQYQDKAVEKLSKGKFSTLPSGLPIAPVPGFWYATTNVWHIQVQGEYARFGLRASCGRPSVPGAQLTYVRDGDNVTLDVDDDGIPERLGKSRRVQFAATVDVVVVVPPGPQGVGDVGGEMNEVSKGWGSYTE